MTTYLQQDSFFKEIYEQFAPKVHRICLGYTADAMQADDLLQETFIKVWENLGKFRGESQLGTWIYRIAVNTCLYHIRSAKNKSTQSIDKIQLQQPEETNDKEQQIALLYQCIYQLPEADRLIITMVLEEVPYPEIALAIGISEGNLRVKIHRIKQQISNIYGKQE